MHTHTTLITKKAALQALSQCRYGFEAVADGRVIHQSTFWRWCDLLDIPSRSDVFTQEQFDRLLDLCRHYRNGKKLIEYLEKMNHAN